MVKYRYAACKLRDIIKNSNLFYYMAKEKAVKATKVVPETMEFTVTEEYLKANPELSTNGIEVGDIIELPAAEVESIESGEGPKAPVVPTGKGAMAILKNGTEYVRTYGPDQKEEMAEFLSKDAAYTAVADASISQIEVPYSTKQKDGTINRTEKRFEDKGEAILFRNEHRSVCKAIFAKK